MSAPLVKICGVTSVGDAELAADLGADLLGLNFWPGSKRYLELSAARDVAAAVAGRVTLVGVFVDAEPGDVEAAVESVGLDLVQFHGDESPEAVARLGRRAIRAFRVGDVFDRRQLADYPDAWGFLFDRAHATLQGGTGERWAYEIIADLPTDRPVLLAGGVGPENVAAALAASGATGIDVCSGVETEPGVKDPDKMRRLFDEVRHVQTAG